MKRSLLMVVMTGMFILVLSYQPPVEGNAQQIKKELTAYFDTSTTHFDTVDSVIDITLLDSLKIYKQKTDSIRSDCRLKLGIIKEQQKIVNRQIKIIDTFTVKN